MPRGSLAQARIKIAGSFLAINLPQNSTTTRPRDPTPHLPAATRVWTLLQLPVVQRFVVDDIGSIENILFRNPVSTIQQAIEAAYGEKSIDRPEIADSRLADATIDVRYLLSRTQEKSRHESITGKRTERAAAIAAFATGSATTVHPYDITLAGKQKSS